MSGTFGLFLFVRWGLLGVLKYNPSKKEKGRVPWPLTFDDHHLNNKYNNQPKVDISGGGDIREGK